MRRPDWEEIGAVASCALVAACLILGAIGTVILAGSLLEPSEFVRAFPWFAPPP